jgi:hypothetical protein
MRSGERTHGWGPKGKIIPYQVTIQKRENFSILPAMNVDGYIACTVYKGGVNAETFQAFIEYDLLPLCRPYPGPNSILIMDNAAIHKNEVYFSNLLLNVESSKSNRVERMSSRIPSTILA